MLGYSHYRRSRRGEGWQRRPSPAIQQVQQLLSSTSGHRRLPAKGRRSFDLRGRAPGQSGQNGAGRPRVRGASATSSAYANRQRLLRPRSADPDGRSGSQVMIGTDHGRVITDWALSGRAADLVGDPQRSSPSDPRSTARQPDAAGGQHLRHDLHGHREDHLAYASSIFTLKDMATVISTGHARGRA